MADQGFNMVTIDRLADISHERRTADFVLIASGSNPPELRRIRENCIWLMSEINQWLRDIGEPIHGQTYGRDDG